MKNQEKKITFRGTYLLSAVLIFYGLLFLVNSPEALLALKKSAAVLVKIIPIICLVILFTALLNYLLRPERIADHLGRKSGVRGWLWALVAGVISHGPMYAWYPLLEDLRSHGMRDGLIAAFFAARTIKVPLLPMMIDYFGLTFTLILSLYILLGALIQGRLLEIMEQHLKNS